MTNKNEIPTTPCEDNFDEPLDDKETSADYSTEETNAKVPNTEEVSK